MLKIDPFVSSDSCSETSVVHVHGRHSTCQVRCSYIFWIERIAPLDGRPSPDAGGDVAHFTPRNWVLEQLSRGRLVILEIDVQGAIQVKSRIPEAFAIFILPPDEATLLERDGIVKRR